MRFTKEELETYLNRNKVVKKKNKYNAKRVKIGNIIFPSQHEANGFIYLKQLEKENKIKGFCRQPIFNLAADISWKPDYLVIKNDLTCIVIEYKGFETADYKIKKSLFIEKYPDIELHIVKRDSTLDIF